MWQTAEYIYENITTNIYFFNVNTLINYNTNIRDILELLQSKILQTRFTEYRKPIVLLFDEVHEDPKWTNTLKIVYDELKTALILSTGSSALLLQTTADLATRMLIRHVFPLSFSEYLSIRNIKKEINGFDLQNNLKQALFYSKDLVELENGLEKFANPDIPDIAFTGQVYVWDRLRIGKGGLEFGERKRLKVEKILYFCKKIRRR